MIYLFAGSDAAKARAKAFEWVAKARAKEPNLLYRRLAREELTPSTLEDAVLASGLFISRLLILLDDPFAKVRATDDGDEEASSENAGIVEEYLDRLAASDNAIVILAPRLAAIQAKKIAVQAKQSYVFDLTARREEDKGFNSALVNALATRSREKLWLEVVSALRVGEVPEQLHGLLHWKARDILARGGAKWKPAEARALSRDLIALLMNTRREGGDLSQTLERFALSI